MLHKRKKSKRQAKAFNVPRCQRRNHCAPRSGKTIWKSARMSQSIRNYALATPTLGVTGPLTGAGVRNALGLAQVLGQASLTGLNPAVALT